MIDDFSIRQYSNCFDNATEPSLTWIFRNFQVSTSPTSTLELALVNSLTGVPKPALATDSPTNSKLVDPTTDSSCKDHRHEDTPDTSVIRLDSNSDESHMKI